jgi:hypothetical protein
MPHGSGSMESKALFGSIKHDSSALVFELYIGKPFRPLSLKLSAVRIHW